MNIEKVIWNSILKLFLLIVGCYLIYQTREIIMILFLVFIVSATLRPMVEFLEKYKIPKFISALSVLLIIFFGIGFLASSLFTQINSQWSDMSQRLSHNYELVIEKTGLDKYLSNDSKTNQKLSGELNKFLTNNVDNLSKTIVNLGASIFSAFLTLITSIALIFYLLADPDKPKRFLVSFLPKNHQPKVYKIFQKTEQKLSYWLAGQLILMFVMGVISYLGFLAIGVDFALPLAVIVALLDIIPVIGSIVAFIPVILIVLVTNPFKIILVFLFYLLIQQLEGNILIPKIMSKSVGLDPIAIITALMVGSSLFGIMGALLSIPIAVILMIIYEELYLKNNDNKLPEKLNDSSS
jgi:predicted PurR-regulated permease PerM